MEQNTQPTPQTPPQPVQPVPPPVESKSSRKQNYLFWIISFLIFVGIASLLGYRYFRLTTAPKNFEECIKAKDSRIRQSYPQTCVSWDGKRFEQPVAIPTPIPTPVVIQAKSLSDSTIITGWKHYENERFSLEIPTRWNIFDYSNQKTYYGDIPTINLMITDDVQDPRYDKEAANNVSSNTIGISLGSEAYKDNKWSDLTSASTFFDLQSSLWTDIMRRSGGGALLQTTIQLDQLAGIQTVKRTNTWTQAMESVDSTDTTFFFPDSKSGGELLVWNIHYQLPLKGTDITERKKIIDQILSTLKFIL